MHRESDKWKKLHDRAVGAANRATHRLTVDDIPVRLRSIALQQRARVILQPLYVEGGLGTDDGGFAIYLNVPANRAAKMQGDFDNSPNGELSLSPRQRFTLAHEVAHTFFYEWSAENPKPRPLVYSHPKERDRLEDDCDEIAGLLLVPDRLLEGVFEKDRPDILDPNVAKDLANRFAVSVDCFVKRLTPMMAKQKENGGIIVVPLDGDLRDPLITHAFASRGFELFYPDRKLNLVAIERCRTAPNGDTGDATYEVLLAHKYGDQRVQVTRVATTERTRYILGVKFINELDQTGPHRTQPTTV